MQSTVQYITNWHLKLLFLLNLVITAFLHIPAFVHIHNYLHNSICIPSMMYLYHMYTYQDLCPRIICILTRTYVLGSYIYLPGPMSLDHKYIYIYINTYQDPCPWIICILARTYILGSYVYLPGLMSLDHMYAYQDLCPWIICILTRTYVLGSYVNLPGLMSLDHTYTYQDLGPWKKQQTNNHKTDSYTEKKITGISMYRQVETEVYRCWIQK